MQKRRHRAYYVIIVGSFATYHTSRLAHIFTVHESHPIPKTATSLVASSFGMFPTVFALLMPSHRLLYSTASDKPTDFFRPSHREGPQSRRGSDAECPRSDERYHSTARAGCYMPEGSPLPLIWSEDSNVTVNSPMSFTRPVPSSDLTPTELEPTSSLERNRMHGSSTESLVPPCPQRIQIPNNLRLHWLCLESRP